MIKIFIYSFLVLLSFNSFSFTCIVKATGDAVNTTGTIVVKVPLTPTLTDGSNIVVDFGQGSSEIDCRDDQPDAYTDKIWPTAGNKFNIPAIKNGSLVWWDKTYSFPMTTHPHDVEVFNSTVLRPLKVKFTLTPTNTAEGIIIKKGEPIGSFQYHQGNQTKEPGNTFTWNIIAANDVYIPTGTCEFNTYDPTVTLSNYNPNKSSRKNINLSIRCSRKTNLSFSLDGQVDSRSDGSIFKNTADNPAKGFGISFFNDGNKIYNDVRQPLGVVDNSYHPLKLSVDYAVINGVPITVGAVRSQVTVNVTYS